MLHSVLHTNLQNPASTIYHPATKSESLGHMFIMIFGAFGWGHRNHSSLLPVQRCAYIITAQYIL